VDPDRQARREDAPRADGHDALADGRLDHRRQIDQPRLLGIVAIEHGVLMIVLELDRDMGVEVGQQQHPRRARANLGDAADQPFARKRRLAARHAFLATHIDENVAGEGAARIRDHLRAQRMNGVLRLEFRQRAELGILGLQSARDLLPLQQAGVLLAELGILTVDRDRVRDALDGAGDGGNRLADGLENRRHAIGDRGAQAVIEHQVGLTEQNHYRRNEHEEGERETLRGCFYGR